MFSEIISSLLQTAVPLAVAWGQRSRARSGGTRSLETVELFQEMFLTSPSEKRLHSPWMAPSGGCSVNIGDSGGAF